MATGGREVLRGRLYYKAKKGSPKRRGVAAFCGHQSTAEGGRAVSALMQVFEDYEKIERPGSKPKGTIKLEGAKIESSYNTPPNSNNNSPAYTSTLLSSEGTVISSSPLSVGSSNSHSGSVSSSSNSEALYAFTVLTSNNELHEFRTDSENDRLRWVKLLQLLVMYPLSPIPEEPKVNPIKDSFRQTLEAKQYNASTKAGALMESAGFRCFLRKRPSGGYGPADKRNTTADVAF